MIPTLFPDLNIDFWRPTELCNWTITNYVCKLINQDPTVDKRDASNFLIHDAKIIKEHVFAGTIAETKANPMATDNQVNRLHFNNFYFIHIDHSLKESRGKKAFNAFFVNYASQLSQESFGYTVQKIM